MDTLPFFLLMLSAMIHASWNLLAKRVSGNLSVLTLGQVLGSAILIPSAFLKFDLSQFWNALPYIGLTSLIQVGYFYVMSFAYKFGEISIVYPVARGIAVAGGVLLGILVLQESISQIALFGMAAVLVGILTLSRLGETSAHLGKSLMLASILGLFSAVGIFVDKKATVLIEPEVYIIGFMWISTVFILPYLITSRKSEFKHALNTHKRLSALIGAGLSLGYLLVLYAFRVGPLSGTIATREVSVVFGTLLGVLVLKERLTQKKLFGIVAIVAGLVCIKLG